MNAVLSIKPEYVREIIAGHKCYEYRTKVFSQSVEKVYIYASSPVSKVVGEFYPVNILIGRPADIWQMTKAYSGITEQLFEEYFEGRKVAYAISIQNLKIYDIPKTLPFRAPQSYRYIETL